MSSTLKTTWYLLKLLKSEASYARGWAGPEDFMNPSSCLGKKPGFYCISACMPHPEEKPNDEFTG